MQEYRCQRTAAYRLKKDMVVRCKGPVDGVAGQEVYRFPSPSWYMATQRMAEVACHFSCGYTRSRTEI